MTNAWMLVAVLAAIPMHAPASDPAAVQDPPGEVDVWQPAGVTRADRNGPADTTDTLDGGGQTAITRVAAPDARRAVEVQGAQARSDVAAGDEARTSLDPATGDAAAKGTSETTSLGTDTGHGTGTETPTTKER